MRINIILFAFLVDGVFGDTEAVSVMEGDPVTLNSGVTKRYEETMRWYFNDTRIALIDGESSKSCLYDGVDGIFRDRLEVDYKTGSLTITNIRSEHTGRYEAEHIRSNSSGKSEHFEPRKCNSTKITKKNSNSQYIIKSFSLTVIASDSGKNKNEAVTEPQDKEMETSSGLSPAAGGIVGVGVVVGVVLLVAAAVVNRRKIINRSIFRNVKEIQKSEEQVFNDETQNEKSLMNGEDRNSLGK